MIRLRFRLVPVAIVLARVLSKKYKLEYSYTRWLHTRSICACTNVATWTLLYFDLIIFFVCRVRIIKVQIIEVGLHCYRTDKFIFLCSCLFWAIRQTFRLYGAWQSRLAKFWSGILRGWETWSYLFPTTVVILCTPHKVLQHYFCQCPVTHSLLLCLGGHLLKLFLSR